MLTALTLLSSLATAWTPGAPAAYSPAAPAVQYQPAAFSALPTGYSALPANAAVAPQFLAQPLPVSPVATSRGAKFGALDLCAVFGVSALLGYGVSRTQATLAARGTQAPKGPFGGSGGPEDGWIGDRGRSVQVQNFENGTDYLFFQGPSPQYAVQDDLPSFFSAENFADMEIKPLQIAVTVVGFGTFAVLLSYLL